MTHPATVLTVVLFVLKLTGVIDWSWWLVFLPFYGSLALAVALAAVAAVIKE